MAVTNRRKKSQVEADDIKRSTRSGDTAAVPVVSDNKRTTDKVNTKKFWSWFETIESDLGIRAPSMRRALEYLDTIPGPITIVETGCARQGPNWTGDGGSTVIWDRYVQSRESGSHVYSVDLDPRSVIGCQPHVSEHVTLTQQHSINYLYHLKLPRVDLLYLDSYDVDWDNWHDSAAHHIKELAAARHLLRPETLVMVDDSPVTGNFIDNSDNTFAIFGMLKVGGKGRWVSEFGSDVGAALMFHHYQIGYTGFTST